MNSYPTDDNSNRIRGVVDRINKEIILFDKAKRGAQSQEKRISFTSLQNIVENYIESMHSPFFDRVKWLMPWDSDKQMMIHLNLGGLAGKKGVFKFNLVDKIKQ